MTTIGVRYCGGCNPQIDRLRVVGDLREALEKMGLEVDLTMDKESPVDILLLINGCMHACLEGEYLGSDPNQRLISVRGEMVDDQYIKEDYIAGTLIKRICSS
jgi:hypothetical protein